MAMTREQERALALARARQRQSQQAAAAQQPAAGGPAPLPATQAPPTQPEPPAGPQLDREALMQQEVERRYGGIPLLGPLISTATRTFGVGNVGAALNTLGDVASFGVAPRVLDTVSNALNPGSGDAGRVAREHTTEQNPAGAIVGVGAALPVGAALLGPVGAVVGNAGRVGNALATGGGAAGNVARMVGVGGATGGLEAATHGEDIGTGIAVGGVAGPVVGAVAGRAIDAVGSIVGNPAKRAWNYIAGKLGETPEAIQDLVDDFVRQTGRQPSLQQVVAAHDAGVIAQFGAQQPYAGVVLREGARRVAEDLPDAARGIVRDAQGALVQPTVSSPLLTGVNPTTATPAAMLNTRDAATDAAMAPIRSTPVQVDPDTVDAINRLGVVSGRKWRELQTRLNDGTATLDDIDKVRKRLSRMNATEFNVDVENVLDDLMTDVGAQVPQYGQLMDEYAAASRYIDGFEIGQAGRGAGSVTDAGLRATMRSREGGDGYAAGQLARTQGSAGQGVGSAASTLRGISEPGTTREAFEQAVGLPAAADRATTAAGATMRGVDTAARTVPSQMLPKDAGQGGREIATALADVAIGAPISGARQGMIAVSKFLQGLNLPTRVQRQVAEGLTSNDPAVVASVIAQLRRARIDERTIRRLHLMAAGIGGRSAAGTLMQTGDE